MQTLQQFREKVKTAPTIWLQIEEIAARHPWGVMEDQLYEIITKELANRTDKLPEEQVIKEAATTSLWDSPGPQFQYFFTDHGLEIWHRTRPNQPQRAV